MSRADRARTLGPLLAMAPAALLAVLAPKCPACLAVWLAFLGAGTAAAVAPLLYPASIAVAAVALAWMVVRRARRRWPPAGRGAGGCWRPRDRMTT
jgi:hypothetical protein